MPTKNSQQIKHSNRARARAKTPVLNHQSASSAMILKRPLPRASIEKAQKIFKSFSLSKFPKDSLPANHVGEGKDPSALPAAQKKVISQKIKALKDSEATIQGMTLALPAGEINKFLPSYSEKASTVQLSDVLVLLSKKMSGTEFYSTGNPTLNRLAAQTQVDQIMQSVKQEGKK